MAIMIVTLPRSFSHTLIKPYKQAMKCVIDNMGLMKGDTQLINWIFPLISKLIYIISFQAFQYLTNITNLA